MRRQIRGGGDGGGIQHTGIQCYVHLCDFCLLISLHVDSITNYSLCDTTGQMVPQAKYDEPSSNNSP